MGCNFQLALLGFVPQPNLQLKLDNLITKNVNGIVIQIYSTLIAYLILNMVDIPKQWGSKLLAKLRFFQACMCQRISYIHWIDKIFRDRLL